MNDMPPIMAFLFKTFGVKLMSAMGMFHTMEVGAKRYIDALTDKSYKSGQFYASKRGTSGPLVDQGILFADLHNKTFQDNTSDIYYRNEAIRLFIN